MTRSLVLEARGKKESVNIHLMFLYVLPPQYVVQGDVGLCRQHTQVLRDAWEPHEQLRDLC